VAVARRIIRPAPGIGRGEGIVQPAMKMADQLSRRLHQCCPRPETAGGAFCAVRFPEAWMPRPPRRTAQLTDVDAAYIAGLIDGEGTIALSRRHARDNRQLVVTISSTELELLEWAQVTIRVGRITRKRASAPHHAPGLTYVVANRQALDLLRQVAPFLRSYKRRRALLALTDYLAVTPRNGKYSPALRAARDRFEREFAAIAIRRQPPLRQDGGHPAGQPEFVGSYRVREPKSSVSSFRNRWWDGNGPQTLLADAGWRDHSVLDPWEHQGLLVRPVPAAVGDR